MTGVQIEKIDRATARSKFMSALLDQQIEDTKKLASDFMLKNRLVVTVPRRIRDGNYKFLGAKSTSNDKFTVFLYEPTDNSNATKFVAYAFSFANDSRIQVYKNDTPEPGKFQYYIEISGLEYCYGETNEEPKVTEATGHVEFSTTARVLGKRVESYICLGPTSNGYGVLPFFYFRSYEAMKDFTQIFISAFPYVSLK